MGALLQFQHSLETVTCYKCGIQFAAPRYFFVKRREDHERWFCPNGHPQVFGGESEAEQLRREKDQLERNLEWVRESRDLQERRANAYKGHLGRVKKRVANGACPCCNRSFQNLARHMATKHPGYSGDDAT